MANTITKGYTFGTTELVTNAKLHALVDSATIAIDTITGELPKGSLPADTAYETAWSDYSATSTIVGWTSFTTKAIYTKKVGNLVFVDFYLAGTSNADSASFTLPYANSVLLARTFFSAQNNSGNFEVGMANFPSGGSTVNFYNNVTGASGGWTTSGTKTVVGQLFYGTT